MTTPVEHLGRYTLHGELAAGGMATVHLGRLLGPAGFLRTVAIKRLHPQFAKDPTFVAMLLDEARLAARLRHTNVVPILDVVATGGEVFLVMEYVHGESLSRLVHEGRVRRARVDPRIAVAVIVGMLHGLHAAHEARGEDGAPLGMVHRDVSPQNVLVGVDGIARVLDFGIAKAAGRLQTTGDGALKGKIAYMAPEMLVGAPVDRRADLWAAGVVLWELLTDRMLFAVDSPAAGVHQVMTAEVPAPSTLGAPRELDAVLKKALTRSVDARFATAREMAVALEEALLPATARSVGEWVEATAAESLAARAKRVEAIEAGGQANADDDPSSVRTKLRALGVSPEGDIKTNAPVTLGDRLGADVATERVDVRGAGPRPETANARAHAQPATPTAAPATATSETPRHRRRAPILFAAVAVVGAAAIFAATRPGTHPVDATAPRPSLSVSVRGDTPSAASTTADIAPPASTLTTAIDAATADASAPTAASATHRRPTTPPHPPPSVAPPSCDPPYRIVDGIRVPKRECL